MIAEMPEALRPFADRVAQRVARVIYSYPPSRDVRPELRKWPVVGMEFVDPKVARAADYRRHTFGLHHFTSWEAGDRWLGVDGTHERWAGCPDCTEIDALYEAWRAEDYADSGTDSGSNRPVEPPDRAQDE